MSGRSARRVVARLAGVLLALASVACAPRPHPAGPAPATAEPTIPSFARRNVVLIVCDDAGYADFGFHGASDIRTPHLDRLATRSARFAQAYVTASVCSPSRAGLLTGRYQQRFGHEMNLPGGPHGLDVATPTVADRLRAHGYRTAAVGKWHLGDGPAYHPRVRGFDHFTGFTGGSRSYFPVERPAARARIERDGVIVPEHEVGYLTDFLGGEAAALVARMAPGPFFLYVAFNAPHTPMHATEADLAAVGPLEPPRRRRYAAMMLALDRAVGTILDAIENAGAADDTVVVFVNDNGGATGNASDNGALRGMKGSKWEGGIRVPMLLHWPGVTTGGTVHPHPVSTLDLAPTLLAAATPEPDLAGFDGVDLRDQLADRAGGAERVLFWRRAVAAAVRAGRWKLVRVDTRPEVLIDLHADPRERRDVASDHAEVVRDLVVRLEDWEARLEPPRWQTGERWRRNQIEKHGMDVIDRDAERRLP